MLKIVFCFLIVVVKGQQLVDVRIAQLNCCEQYKQGWHNIREDVFMLFINVSETIP